jgi:hypothetical protein
MKRVDLDFLPRRRAGRLTGMVALGLAALAAAKLADFYATSLAEADSLEARMARLERRSPEFAAAQALPESTLREIRHANEVIDQIATPWTRLFAAIDAAGSSKVALLGIEPDPRDGTVEISAESADLRAMFDYVKRLDRQATLDGVYLLNHQIDMQNPQRPVRFKVTAAWARPASRL